MIHRGDDCSKLKQISDSNLVRSVCALLDRIEQPIQKMGQILALMEKLKTTLEGMTTSESPCGRETLPMMAERWAKLHRDFYNKKERTYDLSKIPDIYDCIRVRNVSRRIYIHGSIHIQIFMYIQKYSHIFRSIHISTHI